MNDVAAFTKAVADAMPDALVAARSDVVGEVSSTQIETVPFKLNLGSGDVPLDGYRNLDGKMGDCLAPLPFASNAADEIRASHVLEHFPTDQVRGVIDEWMRVLKPGGVLKIAVPNFEWIARQYLDGAQIPVEGYVMGGQTDSRDFHKALFDRESLEIIMTEAGLVGLRPWVSEIKDCAALPVSLNIAGTKPGGKRPKVAAVLSMPRLAFADNMACVAQIASLGIRCRKVTGAFWGQCLTRVIEMALEEDAPDYILTIDYDTVWTPQTFNLLLDVAQRHPEADVIAPLQAKRGESHPLIFIKAKDGQVVSDVPREVFDADLVPVTSAHFGLTLLKADMLRNLPRPWFQGVPDADGRWGDGRVDDDIWFWRQLEKAGVQGFIAPRVVVGHGQFMVSWPDINLETVYQHATDFWNVGAPKDVWK